MLSTIWTKAHEYCAIDSMVLHSSLAALNAQLFGITKDVKAAAVYGAARVGVSQLLVIGAAHLFVPSFGKEIGNFLEDFFSEETAPKTMAFTVVRICSLCTLLSISSLLIPGAGIFAGRHLTRHFTTARTPLSWREIALLEGAQAVEKAAFTSIVSGD